MPKKHRAGKRESKTPWPQIASLAGLIVLIVGVLIAKNQAQPAAVPTLSPPVVRPTVASGQTQPTAAPTGLPETQLDQLLAAKHPTLAFFHSDTCQQCIEMTQIVQQVYPEFAGSVALVDVNVYDDRNARLLQRASIRVIPTLVFFNREGKGQVTTGVMQPAQLRQALQSLGGS
jgi:thiol:disulfide interchange protein